MESRMPSLLNLRMLKIETTTFRRIPRTRILFEVWMG